MVCNAENLGVAPARNQGICPVQGEYVLILDDETIVQPGALDRLIRYMEDQPEMELFDERIFYGPEDIDL